MMQGQWLSQQPASSTRQVTSCPFDYWIGMRELQRMMMTRTGRILEHRAVEEALLPMAMIMAKVKVRSKCRAVGKTAEKGRERKMGRGIRRRQRTGRGRGRGRGRGSGWGRGQGKVLWNKPQEKKARKAVQKLQGVRGMVHGGLTWRVY